MEYAAAYRMMSVFSPEVSFILRDFLLCDKFIESAKKYLVRDIQGCLNLSNLKIDNREDTNGTNERTSGRYHRQIEKGN